MYQYLLEVRSSKSFKYVNHEATYQQLALRHVCLPHLPGFWNHTIVGGQQPPPPTCEEMFAADPYLPWLFNVDMQGFRLHWCCFVLTTRIILGLWCTVRDEQEVYRTATLTQVSALHTDSFKSMLFCLTRWFRSVFEKRTVEVVLSKGDRESLQFQNVLALLAQRYGVRPPREYAPAANNQVNANIADALFCFPGNPATLGPSINIEREYNTYCAADEPAAQTPIYTDLYI